MLSLKGLLLATSVIFYIFPSTTLTYSDQNLKKLLDILNKPSSESNQRNSDKLEYQTGAQNSSNRHKNRKVYKPSHIASNSNDSFLSVSEVKSRLERFSTEIQRLKDEVEVTKEALEDYKNKVSDSTPDSDDKKSFFNISSWFSSKSDTAQKNENMEELRKFEPKVEQLGNLVKILSNDIKCLLNYSHDSVKQMNFSPKINDEEIVDARLVIKDTLKKSEKITVFGDISLLYEEAATLQAEISALYREIEIQKQLQMD
jgi:uncharacterized small protein (DUF1192 family)